MWKFKAFRSKYSPCWESICIAENTGAIVQHPSAQSECCWAERSVSRKETKTNCEAGGHANVNFSPPNASVFTALQRTHPRTSHFESQHHHSIQTIVFHFWTPYITLTSRGHAFNGNALQQELIC